MQTLPATTTGNKEYVVKRLSESNVRDLATLHHAVYGRLPADDYYPRKYDTAYTGHQWVGYLAYNDLGAVIAYYGVIPCFIQLEEGIQLAAQSADTMTHPGFRMKGMFVDLSLQVFELCRRSGIRLLFGFPNDNSYHGAVSKLGWQQTHRMECFQIRVRTLPIQRLANHSTFIRAMHDKWVERCLRSVTGSLQSFRNSVIDDGFAGVCRSAEYMRYKLYNPSRSILLNGVRLWVRYKQGLWIGDMERVTEQNFLPTLQCLQRLCKKAGIASVQFHVSPGTLAQRLLSKTFESVPSYHMLFQDFGSAIPPGEVRFTFADIDIF